MAKAGDKKITVIVIILFAIALGVITALCYYKWVGNKAKKDEISDIEKQIKVQEVIKEGIAGLSQEKTQRVEAINQLTKILPTRTMASHQEFLYLLRGFAKSAGVTVTSLLPPREVPNPELRTIRYKYIILVDGTFPQFVRFLSQIERHERFLKVDAFEIANQKLGAGYWPPTTMKKIRLEITTYTYQP